MKISKNILWFLIKCAHFWWIFVIYFYFKNVKKFAIINFSITIIINFIKNMDYFFLT